MFDGPYVWNSLPSSLPAVTSAVTKDKATSYQLKFYVSLSTKYGDVLSSKYFGVVLKKLNPTQKASNPKTQ